MKFHHIGKPVPLAQIKDDPAIKYSSLYDMYSLDQLNELGIPVELHAFGPNSSLDARIQAESHVAFVTDDIQRDLAGQEIIMDLYQPFAGYQCAMILLKGVPVELIQTTLSEAEIWGDGPFKDSILYPENN
ncbi:hypothetical protein EQG49_07140 [Periweissella cryptocerci]|uniref:Uncharacterized protein n=1 Tax=Periweissella cryptocerci TaxID=2506420 RepID=A0A4P6YU50_9LACO|nr:hypothetical protein [Periweissella cryptocerci]QBO36250.1 hypothetical protein EQG49_07140 [Periweissella cryptocerci]